MGSLSKSPMYSEKMQCFDVVKKIPSVNPIVKYALKHFNSLVNLIHYPKINVKVNPYTDYTVYTELLSPAG